MGDRERWTERLEAAGAIRREDLPENSLAALAFDTFVVPNTDEPDSAEFQQILVDGVADLLALAYHMGGADFLRGLGSDVKVVTVEVDDERRS